MSATASKDAALLSAPTNAATKIQFESLSHVHYQLPDLAQANKFLLDFGLIPVNETSTRIYYKGVGRQPLLYIAEQSPTKQRTFIAGAWNVKSLEDLELATKLPNATSIADYEGPSGGKVVTVKDPNGFEVRLLFGQNMVSDAEVPPSYVNSEFETNTAGTKPRKGLFVRLKPGPSKVHKLGHYGFSVEKSKTQSTLEWYSTTFNLKLTDAVYDKETGIDETSFLHIDKGLEYSDHHVSSTSSDQV